MDKKYYNELELLEKIKKEYKNNAVTKGEHLCCILYGKTYK